MQGSGAALLLIRPKMKTYLKYAYECKYYIYVAFVVAIYGLSGKLIAS